MLNGVAGTFTLANTGTLTFAATGSQLATFVDSNVAEFNVDTARGAPNLWELKTNGNLWELPGGNTMNWMLQDQNTGAISLAPNGVLSDLKLNGNLWRFKPGDPMGGFGSTPLASGVTDASVDAQGNVYGLKDGNLLEWSAATPTVATVLNTSTVANASLGAANAGHVVSFQVGNNTVAFQLGYGDPLSGEVFVSYNNGATLTALSSAAAGKAVTASQYGVANDGTVFVRTDTAGAVNAGKVVQLSVTGKVTDTDLGTAVMVNGNAAQWFELSPDGTWIAADSKGNLSAYTIGIGGAGVLGAEDMLETAGKAASFGIANDNRVYELTTGGVANSLLQWTPSLSALTGASDGKASASATVNTSVGQWVLGANGQVAYLKGAAAPGGGPGTYFWGNDNGLAQRQDSMPVAEIGVSRNGAQYELETSGVLWQWNGGNAMFGQMSPWRMLDAGVSAFVVSTNSALYETESNGNLWRFSGDTMSMNMSMMMMMMTTTMPNWTLLSSTASVGSSIGSAQDGVSNGAPLYVLPDGTVVTLVNGSFEQITADRSQATVGLNSISWGNFVAAGLIDKPGQNGFSPAFNPGTVLGGQFSNVNGNPASPILV
jgi:hypothetical protein